MVGITGILIACERLFVYPIVVAYWPAMLGVTPPPLKKFYSLAVWGKLSKWPRSSRVVKFFCLMASCFDFYNNSIVEIPLESLEGSAEARAVWAADVLSGETELYFISWRRTPAFKSLDDVVSNPLSYWRMMLRILVVMVVFKFGFRIT